MKESFQDRYKKIHLLAENHAKDFAQVILESFLPDQGKTAVKIIEYGSARWAALKI